MSKEMLELANEAELLSTNYETFLCVHVNAWREFCRKHREEIVAALRASAVAEPVATSNADICPQCGLNRNSPFPCEHTHLAPTREEIIEQCLTAARSGFEKAMEQYILIGPSGMAMMMINSIRALKEDKC